MWGASHLVKPLRLQSYADLGVLKPTYLIGLWGAYLSLVSSCLFTRSNTKDQYHQIVIDLNPEGLLPTYRLGYSPAPQTASADVANVPEALWKGLK